MVKVIDKKLIGFVILCIAIVFSSMVYSHGQIPCGIYDDPARFEMVSEHITTIEKSMKQIAQLSKQVSLDMNQIVRWVQNKEKHTDELSAIVTYYFMAQRVKPVEKAEGKAYQDYVKKLTLLHEMLVYGMKAKQTTDLSNVEKLRTLLAEFQTAYFQETVNKH